MTTRCSSCSRRFAWLFRTEANDRCRPPTLSIGALPPRVVPTSTVQAGRVFHRAQQPVSAPGVPGAATPARRRLSASAAASNPSPVPVPVPRVRFFLRSPTLRQALLRVRWQPVICRRDGGAAGAVSCRRRGRSRAPAPLRRRLPCPEPCRPACHPVGCPASHLFARPACCPACRPSSGRTAALRRDACDLAAGICRGRVTGCPDVCRRQTVHRRGDAQNCRVGCPDVRAVCSFQARCRFRTGPAIAGRIFRASGAPPVQPPASVGGGGGGAAGATTVTAGGSVLGLGAVAASSISSSLSSRSW